MTDILAATCAETARFQGGEYPRCFWRVEEGGRSCGNRGIHEYGPDLAFCHVHDDKFRVALISEIREDPRFRDMLINYVAEYDREEARLWTEHRKEVKEWPAKYGRAHCVYFAERDGFVKIGRTADVDRRMRDIGKGSCMPQGMTIGPVRLLAVIYCDCAMPRCIREHHFHGKFRGQWLEGEWFLLDQELSSFIGGLEECLDDRLREVSAPVAA